MTDYIMWKVDFIAYIGGGTAADCLAIAFYHDLNVSAPGRALGISGILGYFYRNKCLEKRLGSANTPRSIDGVFY